MSSEPVHITVPFTPSDEKTILALKAGDEVLISGSLYTGRDAAHKRFSEVLARGEPLPVDLKGQVIYYVGPSPAKPGEIIGSAGPTTATRMDSYTPQLLALGLKGMIGKGKRSEEVRRAMQEYGAIYFGAVGGLGVLLGRSIKKSEIVAYPDLGPEAVFRLEVEKFPAIVICDVNGGDLYSSALLDWGI